MALSLLDKAEKMLRRKHFAEVLSLLQPHIMEYDYSFRCFYILATACLYLKDYKGARDYYKCARRIKPRDTDMILGNAILYLRRNDIPSAIDCYLEILEYDPTSRQAKIALNFLRRLDSPEQLPQKFETGKLYSFFPPIKFKHQGILRRRTVAIAVVIVIVCIAIGVGVNYYLKKNPALVRADLSSVMLSSDDKQNLLELGGTYRYILTSTDVETVFANARKSFQKYDDNVAQVAVNKILYSNASASVKRKARFLMDFFAVPGFDTIKTNYSFNEVKLDPYLYLDCAVVWKGRATNIQVTDTYTSCDFLIGYENREKLEGIVPVIFDGSVTIESDKPLTVLARIAIHDKKLQLKGLSVFQPYKQ